MAFCTWLALSVLLFAIFTWLDGENTSEKSRTWWAALTGLALVFIIFSWEERKKTREARWQELIEIAPEMQEMLEKYPELKDEPDD